MKQAKVLNRQEFKRLNAVVGSTRMAERNRVAVALSFYAGLRACEIASLRIGHAFNFTGVMNDFLRFEKHQTKGNEANSVPVSRRMSQALARYATAYPNWVSDQSNPILFSAKGGAMSSQTVINLFAHLYRAAGIIGASSHSGRRQFVTALAEKGINPRVIQALARHKHLNTTQRYIDINDHKLQKAIELIDL
jgi:integrase/recombinase XerD